MTTTSLHEQIATSLICNAVNDGFIICINNGEETSVERSRNSSEIINAMFQTEMDMVTLSVEERRVGFITLIYDNEENGFAVIADYTDIPHINRLVEHTMKEFER